MKTLDIIKETKICKKCKGKCIIDNMECSACEGEGTISFYVNKKENDIEIFRTPKSQKNKRNFYE